MFGLKKSKIVGDGFIFFNIPKVRNVKVAAYNDGTYITLVGLDKRNIWFRLGDRPDLKPEKLKDFGLTCCRDGGKTEQEEFIKKVVKTFGN